MKISDLLRMCADNLLRRKGRSILTIIGVVVGTCSIVVMISFGVAINKEYDDMFTNMGDLTVVQVYNWSGDKNVPNLDDDQLAFIKAMPGVQAATPFSQSRYMGGQLFAGKGERYYTYAGNIVGVYPDALEAFGYPLMEGGFDITYKSGSKEIPVLMGEAAAYSFMDSRRRDEQVYYQTGEDGTYPAPYFDYTKEKITLRTDKSDESSKEVTATLKGVGRLAQNNGIYYTYSGIIMDINALRELEQAYLKANNIKLTTDQKKVNYNEVYVKATSVDEVAAVEEAIKELGYSTYSMTSMREEMQKSTQTIQFILGGLGAISMFVAALSIANTMTMAIYERTKEIGIMKVLGCRLNNIRTMFLVESGMIGFAGGIIGLVISFLISMGINRLGASMGSTLSYIPLWLAGLGLGFSTFVGLLSGFAPANRAMKISALEAIRHE